MAKSDTSIEAAPENAAAGPSGIKKWLPLSIGMFLLITLSQAIAPLITQPIMGKIMPPPPVAGEAASEEAPAADPIYWPISPAMVVNFGGDANSFLQISVEVMARSQEVIDAVKTHDAAIRNDMLMLFASKNFESLSTREGKEQLRAEVLSTLQGVLAPYVNEDNIEAVYFTAFVAQ